VKTSDLPAADFRLFSPEQMSFAARAWRMKSDQEYLSAGVFAELTAALLDEGGPLGMTAGFGRIVAEEIEHAALCDGLACELGDRQPRASRTSIRTRLAPCGGDRHLEALSLLLIEGAIGETISTALFRASAGHAQEPRSKACLSRILGDEAGHARFCWATLTTLLDGTSDTDRARLQAGLSEALGSLERQNALPILQRLDRGEAVPAELVALGVIQLEERVNVFYRTLENAVFSKLTALGFDAAKAWEGRFR
jgi:hypothetical protein